MARQDTAIFGIYRDSERVERAAAILQGVGVRNTDISLLFPKNEGTKNFALQKRSMSPEATAADVGAVAVVSGVLGWLVGIGVLTVPGLGSFFVAGPIVGALAGVGPGGVTGLVGSLLGLGLSEYEAKSYEDQIRRGGILMSVHCDRPDYSKRAKQVFHETGAEDIASGGEANADFIENDKPVLRHVARRRIRSLTALRASRNSGRGVRVNRFWNRAKVITDAIRGSNRNTIVPEDRQAKNFAEEGPVLVLPA